MHSVRARRADLGNARHPVGAIRCSGGSGPSSSGDAVPTSDGGAQQLASHHPHGGYVSAPRAIGQPATAAGSSVVRLSACGATRCTEYNKPVRTRPQPYLAAHFSHVAMSAAVELNRESEVSHGTREGNYGYLADRGCPCR